MNITFNTGKVFGSTDYYVNKGKKVIIHKGGTGSGKTFEIMLYLFIQALNKSGLVITTVSESFPHLKIGTMRTLSSFCQDNGLWTKDNWNKAESVWRSPTGSIIEFFSADRIGKALGARRNILYANEVNHLKESVFDELARRSDIIIADFNPTSMFWIEKWQQNYLDVVTITSNYKDNVSLPAAERERIKLRAKRDENFRRIHVLCEYGIFEGLIFSNWHQIDTMPEGNKKYGLDWGFTNDPTALVAVVEDDDNIYVDELLYRTGMLNRDIISMMGQLGIRKRYDEIFADSSEPKSIKAIFDAGYNIKGAVKGKDSIKAGIDRILSKNLFVTKRSVNIIRELRSYSWVVDKEGNKTNKPTDINNHAIDAIRYAIEPRLKYEYDIK